MHLEPLFFSRLDDHRFPGRHDPVHRYLDDVLTGGDRDPCVSFALAFGPFDGDRVAVGGDHGIL